MTTAMPNAAQSFLHRYQGLRQRLPGGAVQACAAQREAASSVLAEQGLPSPRDEAWKYTNLAPVSALSFQESLTEITNRLDRNDDSLRKLLPKLGVPHLMFVDGRFRADLSDVPGTISFGTFAETPRFGAAAMPDRERLVALNTMLAEDGAQIEVAENKDGGTLMLASVCCDRTGRTIAVHPRHAITLRAGSTLTVFEVSAGEGAYLHNPVTEIHVEKGATLTHIRLQKESDAAFHCSTIYADIDEDATYDSFLLTLGAALARAEVHTALRGPNGTVHLNGAQLLGGKQHADFATQVSHKAPNCSSNQTVKNVLADRARAVFQGKISVDRVAQKTDGYQMNQALLLSRDAEINAKPELEIYADDVKCSHGATVGELDPDQLFLLRCRGIGEAEARSILVRAFLSEALDPVANPDIRAILDQAIEAWWERN